MWLLIESGTSVHFLVLATGDSGLVLDLWFQVDGSCGSLASLTTLCVLRS